MCVCMRLYSGVWRGGFVAENWSVLHDEYESERSFLGSFLGNPGARVGVAVASYG